MTQRLQILFFWPPNVLCCQCIRYSSFYGSILSQELQCISGGQQWGFRSHKHVHEFDILMSRRCFLSCHIHFSFFLVLLFTIQCWSELLVSVFHLSSMHPGIWNYWQFQVFCLTYWCPFWIHCWSLSSLLCIHRQAMFWQDILLQLTKY